MRLDVLAKALDTFGHPVGTDAGVVGPDNGVDVVTRRFAVGFEFVDHLLRRAEDDPVSRLLFTLSVEFADGLAGENLLVVLLNIKSAVAHLLPGVLAGVLGADIIDGDSAIAHQEVNSRSPIEYGMVVTVLGH